jgi:hypothetical protein
MMDRLLAQITGLHPPDHEILGRSRSAVCSLSYHQPPTPLFDFLQFRIPTPIYCRKQRKRSHTLRYVLKNRATNKVLFVVLFTLYLKEDVDENGNIKEGVVDDANKQFEERSEESKKRHGRGKGGSWWWGGGDVAENEDESESEVVDEKAEDKLVDYGKTTPAQTNDDDVD